MLLQPQVTDRGHYATCRLPIKIGDWNGAIGLNLYWPEHASKTFCEEFLILWMQAGGNINVDSIVSHNQDWFEHMGGFGKKIHVDEELQKYRKGRLYKLTKEDKWRIEMRKELIKKPKGRVSSQPLGAFHNP